MGDPERQLTRSDTPLAVKRDRHANILQSDSVKSRLSNRLDDRLGEDGGLRLSLSIDMVLLQGRDAPRLFSVNSLSAARKASNSRRP